MPNERILPDISRDSEVRLNSDPFFFHIAIINYRKGDISSEVAAALCGITPKNGRSGACVIIRQPLANAANDNVRFPPLDTLFAFLVLTYPLFNDDVNTGTTIPAEAICQRILDLFSQFHPVGVTTPFVPQKPTIVPDEVRVPSGAEGEAFLPIAYECRFGARTARGRGLSQPDLPLITIGASNVSISCATGAVDIYYTLDGSPPGPPAVSPGSTRYDGTPFAPTFSCIIRAVAMRQQSGYDWTPSDIAWAQWDEALADNQGAPIEAQSEGGEPVGV